MNLGVALPDWMFAKDKKAAPLMLLGLVGCGILLPLGLMSWYMLSSSKFSGPNQIMNDTFPIFMYSKYGIKESQVRGRRGGSMFCVCVWVGRGGGVQLTRELDRRGMAKPLQLLRAIKRVHVPGSVVHICM